MRSFSRDDLTRFVDQRYRPGQMILSAAGAVDHDALVKLAEEAFGDMQPSNTVAPPAAKFAGGETRTVRTLEQAHFAMAFESSNYSSPDIHTAQIYASALGGSMSSRLFQKFASGGGCAIRSLRRPGPMRIPGCLRSMPALRRTRWKALAG